MTASIGIAVYPDDGDESRELFRRADGALTMPSAPVAIACAPAFHASPAENHTVFFLGTGSGFPRKRFSERPFGNGPAKR